MKPSSFRPNPSRKLVDPRLIPAGSWLPASETPDQRLADAETSAARQAPRMRANMLTREGMLGDQGSVYF